MSYSRTVMIPNGDIMVKLQYFTCNKCGEEIKESDRHSSQGNDEHYCVECSFKKGIVSSREYLDSIGLGVTLFNAAVKDGAIHIWRGKKAPWDKTNKEQRNSPEYREWRDSVFQRDDYTCQKCGLRGGELNAHHIKPFAKYKDLRLDVSNGITLCIDCHKGEHQMKR